MVRRAWMLGVALALVVAGCGGSSASQGYYRVVALPLHLPAGPYISDRLVGGPVLRYDVGDPAAAAREVSRFMDSSCRPLTGAPALHFRCAGLDVHLVKVPAPKPVTGAYIDQVTPHPEGPQLTPAAITFHANPYNQRATAAALSLRLPGWLSVRSPMYCVPTAEQPLKYVCHGVRLDLSVKLNRAGYLLAVKGSGYFINVIRATAVGSG